MSSTTEAVGLEREVAFYLEGSDGHVVFSHAVFI